MGRKGNATDLTIFPEDGPSVDDFIKALRGPRNIDDQELISWFENDQGHKVMQKIEGILEEFGMSKKQARSIYDLLERRLESQSSESYSVEVMTKIMDGYRRSIEHIFQGFQNR